MSWASAHCASFCGVSVLPSQAKENWQPFCHLALIDDAADRLRELRAAHPVQDDLADGDLALYRLAARLEIDGGGEAAALALLEFGLALAL